MESDALHEEEGAIYAMSEMIEASMKICLKVTQLSEAEGGL